MRLNIMIKVIPFFCRKIADVPSNRTSSAFLARILVPRKILVRFTNGTRPRPFYKVRGLAKFAKEDRWIAER